MRDSYLGLNEYGRDPSQEADGHDELIRRVAAETLCCAEDGSDAEFQRDSAKRFKRSEDSAVRDNSTFDLDGIQFSVLLQDKINFAAVPISIII